MKTRGTSRSLAHAIGSISFVLIMTAFLVPLAEAASETEVGDFLVSFGQRAAHELNDDTLSRNEREDRFKALFNEAVDLPAISRFVLGRSWRAASEADRQAFLRVFETMAQRRFMPLFTRQSDAYKGKGFDVLGTEQPRGRSKTLLVHTRFQRESGGETSLVWRVGKRGEDFRIVDVMVEGISMALTLRQEYGTAVKRLGGVAELVAHLSTKIDGDTLAENSGLQTN